MKIRPLIFIYSLILATGLLTGCGEPKVPLVSTEQWGDGIVGGQLVPHKKSNFRNLVFQLINIESEQVCTAVYYQKKTLLTAAHCIPQQSQNLIIFDEISGRNIHAQKIIVDPSYLENQKTGNDLAFVILKEDFFVTNLEGGVKWSGTGQFDIAMDNNLAISNDFIILGFGRTFSEDLQDPKLRSLKLKNQKNLFLENEGLLRLSQATKRGICFGDSGGPLFKVSKDKLQLIGIAKEVRQSSSQHSEECWGEGVWTDLRPLQNEIQKVLELGLQQ